MSIRLAFWAAAMLMASAAQGSIPLFFEENKGQTDSRVDFLARGSAYVLFLDNGEAVLKLKDRAVRMSLPGASRRAAVRGLQPLPGRSNYFRAGSDPVISVVQYGRVMYEQVYPGIDLVYYGKAGRLEYDFIVAPGADPTRIRLRFDSGVRLDVKGNLVAAGGLSFERPVVYQEVGGRRVQIAGEFRLRGSDVTFRVGKYRRDLPLIIDPVLSYSTYIGGSGNDSIDAMAVDGAGNAYLAGTTTSADFPVSGAAFDKSHAGQTDVFVTKLNASGTAIEYATYLGGPSGDSVTDLALGPDGSVVVVGNIDVPVTSGAYDKNGFTSVVKLQPSGSAIVFSARVQVYGLSVAVAPDGTLFLGGQSGDALAEGTSGVVQPVLAGQTDGAIIRLNATGTNVLSATYLGGPEWDRITDIAVQGDAVYVCGGTESDNFPTTAASLKTPGARNFVAKLSSDLKTLVYSAITGAGYSSSQPTLAVGPDGTVWLAGAAGNPLANPLVTPGAYLTALAPAHLLRLNASGSALLFATYVGSSQQSCCYSFDRIHVAAGPDLEAVVAGRIYGPTTEDAFQPIGTNLLPHQIGSPYIARFNAAGSVLRYATAFGTSQESVAGLALDSRGSIYVAGTSSSSIPIPVTANALQLAPKGTPDGYLFKLDNTDLACSFSLTSASQAFPASGGNSTVGVVAGMGCTWAVTTEPWIKIRSGGSGTGSGALSFDLDPNLAATQRTGTLKIANQTLTVTQAAAPCLYSIAPVSQAFDYRGGVSHVAVTAPTGCSWTAQNNAPWIAVTTNNTNSVQYSVAPNSGGARTGTITVAGHTFTVTQTANPCGFALSTQQLAVPLAGGRFSVNLTAATGCAWTTSNPASWIAVEKGLTGNGPGTIELVIAPNASWERQAGLVIAGQTLRVSQGGTPCAASVPSATYTVPGGGGDYTVAVTTAGCPWSAVSEADWISIVGSSSANGSGQLTFRVAPFVGAPRSGTIRIGAQNITVNQAEGTCSFTVNPAYVEGQALGGTQTRLITASAPTCQWASSSSVQWAQVYPLTGTGSGSVMVTFMPNFSGSTRSGTITVAGKPLPGYQYNAPGTSDDRFVGQLYFGAFGRLGAPAEVAGHVASGISRPNLVETFLNVPEFHNAAKFVAGLYVGILGRDAEYGGWMFQRNAMAQSGATPFALVENFLNSAEFKLRNPNLSDADFVRLLYRQVLGREGTPEEIAFQTANLKSRVHMATGFLMSEEYKIRVGPRLTGFLLHAILLQRDPTKAELDARAAQIASGTPLTTIIGQMLPAQQ